MISLFLLIALLLLAVSAAKMALQGEKISRGDRDRQIAFQAAEAALIDAELDIQGAPDGIRSRSHIFDSHSVQGFPEEKEVLCQAGETSLYLGLCRSTSANEPPVWQLVDFDESHPAAMHSVPYGRFTGRKFDTEKGVAPSRLPRYIIELLVCNLPGEDAGRRGYFYRVTAIGYGMRDATQVVLQSIYRKADV